MKRPIYILLLLLSSIRLFAGEQSQASLERNIASTILSDYRSFYSTRSITWMVAGIGVSGMFANTAADRRIQNWFQEEIRSDGTDRISKVVKPIGSAYEPPAVYAAITLLGYLTKRTASGAAALDWGSTSLRAIVVGAPLVGALQYTLGASRPHESGSEWRPFNDTNGVSGHAFMGAVPFFAAARMIKPVYLKTVLYAGSAATALSRINDNQHYFSQAFAGWWIAYLAVHRLDSGKQPKAALNPVFLPHGWKMQLCFSF